MGLELPTGWRYEPLKFHCSFGKGLSIQKADLVDSGVAVISYGQVHAKSNNGTHISGGLVRYVPRSLAPTASFARLRRGDLVYADTSEDIEGVGNAAFIDTDEEIYAGYHTLVCRPDGNALSGKYLAYLSRADWWRMQLRSMVMGVKVFSVTQSIMSRAYVPIPPLSVQDGIVRKLDEACGAIDQACSVAEIQLSTLERYRASVIHEAVTRGLDPSAPTKPSNVDWIGDIPQGWEVKQLKYFAKSDLGLMLDEKRLTDKNVHEYLANKDVQWFKVNTDNLSETSFPVGSDSRYGICDGDILVCEGGEVGRCAVWHGPSPDFYYQKAIHRVRVDGLMANPDYIAYQLFVKAKLTNFSEVRKGVSTIAHLPGDQLMRLKFTLPPLDEQRAIADYLDARTAAIDAVIETKRRQLDVLKRRRQSLIYEYVTGKRRVGEEG